MSTKRVIAVLGATGAQGGGLVRAILNDPNSKFSVRAITRNPESDKAKELAQLGAEIVAADVYNVESLINAFSGAYGAFLVSFHWEHFSAEREWQELKNMASAAKQANVQHVVFSTLEDTREFMELDDPRMPTLGGKYKVPHFDIKGQANKLFVDMKIPTTFLLTSFYWENFITHGLGPQRDASGRLVFTLPMADKKLPSIAVEDIGKCAYGIFKAGEEYIGEKVGIVGEHLTGEQLAEAFSASFNEHVTYAPFSHEAFRALGFPGAADIGNMLQFKCEFNQEYVGARSVALSRRLNPELQTFTEWLSVQKKVTADVA
ncbi:NmrA-like family domain-containing protein 1 [Fibrisoma limi BUZ 3]|uniref:NmrA-like family domain-containing protein 1 n=1 Tax=Fibrisoma limi BUZ 3 TaxID=1185876 RepID=I2GK23_9BACT|nr:NmrA/HSCARG family protein [Fibrisoma limi]CCH54248.1 NmrA-like family domain-containing protein 1 [Fibrisoma limi BUZ 3]